MIPEVDPSYKPLEPVVKPLTEYPTPYQDIFKSLLGVRGLTTGNLWIENDDPIWTLITVQQGLPIEQAAKQWSLPLALFVTVEQYSGPLKDRLGVFSKIIEQKKDYLLTISDEKLRFAIECHFSNYTQQ